MNKINELKRVLPAIPNCVPGLRKESKNSLCGSCLKCGGDDRFVYHTDEQRFWCRQCNEKGGDVIDFHIWLNGYTIKDLLAKYLPTSIPTKTTNQKTKPFEHYQLGFPVEKYPYADAKGKVLYWSCRFEPKAFRQCSADGLSWTVKDIHKVPYNLPKVIESDTVFIVEGEKDVHSLAKLNLVGTCNVGGAGNWTEDFNPFFKDKKIYLIPDNDEPGRKHVAKLFKNLNYHTSVPPIKLIELPGLKEHGDFSDWLKTFDDIDEAGERFAIMVENAKLYVPESKGDEPKIEIISLEEITQLEIENRPIITGLLDHRESLILSAASGSGKSLLMNQLALTLGNPPLNGLWGLFSVPNAVKSLIVQSENSIRSFNKRLNKLFKACPEMRAGAKNVFTFKVGDDCRLAGILTETDFQKLLIDSLLSIEAGNLILDPLISYHSEDENDNAAMRRSLDCLSRICDTANVSVMLCHHYNRENRTRGAASIRDWTSNMLLMDFSGRNDDDSIILRITHDKSRNYETQPDFYLERTKNLQFLRCEKPGQQKSRILQQIEAVITALTAMGGYVESQTLLKNSVMIELNCSEATARRAIKEAMEMKKIIITPGSKKGKPTSYALPVSQS